MYNKANRYELFLVNKGNEKRRNTFMKEVSSHKKYEKKYEYVMGRLKKQMNLKNVDKHHEFDKAGKYRRDRNRELLKNNVF